MSFKEKVKKFLDDQRLDREMRIARKNIADKEKEKVQVVKLENKEDARNVNSNEKHEDKKFKFNVERLKDVGLVAVAITLIGIGYTNFSGKDTDMENQIIQTASEYGNNLGDVQLVNSGEAELVENDNTINDVESTSSDSNEIQNENSNLISSNNEVSTSAESEASNTVNATNTTSSTNTEEYFVQLKLNRDNLYSQKLEAYEQIVDSSSISSEQKAIAIQEIEKITEMQNSISVAEELIKLKGFEDVVIYVNENSVTVIVRTANLTSDQVAQIQNIVTRQLDVDVSNISISNK